jgi:hypothetical protein
MKKNEIKIEILIIKRNETTTEGLMMKKNEIIIGM